MKEDNSIMKLIAGVIGIMAVVSNDVQAQTVLSGNHIIEGNLNVGTPTDEGNITVTGQIGNTAAPGLKVTGDGGVLFEGTLGVGTIPVEGVGARMMWYPKKAAFRVGSATVSAWVSDAAIGQNSVAFGTALASGASSVAMAGGQASGLRAVALSNGTAHGASSTAMSYGVVSQYGIGAVAMSGGQTMVPFATALSGGTAQGAGSTAISGGLAQGTDSVAMTLGCALGTASVAIGPDVMSQSLNCVVVGRSNATFIESSDTWVPTDSIFIVGNGTGVASDPPEIRRSNAFVIRKNGNIEMMAKVKMPRQGDILMGEFGE